MIARSTASKNCGVGSDGTERIDAAGHQKSKSMDRITWIWTEHHVAGRGDRLGHIGKALFGAECRNDLGLRIEFHAEAAVVIGGLRLAQAE